MRKIFIAMALMLLLFFAALLIVKFNYPAGQKPVPSNLYVDREKSYYREYYVDNNTVHILCNVRVANDTDDWQHFSLFAKLPDDLNGGLLTESIAHEASSLNGMVSVHSLEPHTSRIYHVNFIGTFGGTNEKHNQLLPIIKIISFKSGV